MADISSKDLVGLAGRIRGQATHAAQIAGISRGGLIDSLSLTVRFPLKTVSEINRHEHFRKRHNRVRDQRGEVARQLQPLTHLLLSLRLPGLTVTMTRISPKLLDTDNLQSALKHVRDEIANQLGTDDAPTGPVSWDVQQRIGKTQSVEITIATAEAAT